MNLPDGIFEIIDHEGNRQFVEYIGRQQGFHCVVCGRGERCFTFNIFSGETIEQAAEARECCKYETWGYGASHVWKLKYADGKPIVHTDATTIELSKLLDEADRREQLAMQEIVALEKRNEGLAQKLEKEQQKVTGVTFKLGQAESEVQRLKALLYDIQNGNKGEG